MAERRIVQFVGDGVNGRWVTWRWAGGVAEGGVQRLPEFGEWTNRLRAALPAADAHGSLAAVRLDGALSVPDQERVLTAGLADVLLPQRLRSQLLACHQSGIRVHVRVAPSPATAAVPWGLLPLDADTRLLDVADVSWIAPILPRDLEKDPGRLDWSQVRGRPALHVLDPIAAHCHQPVLGSETELPQLLRSAGGTLVHQQPYTRRDLSRDLRAGVSRLFLLGHCVTSGSAGETGFLLSDELGEYGVGRPNRFRLPLAAADLLRGTLNDDSDQLAGDALWPMPHRVAVVACASGADMTDHEPFGFTTALLIDGADTVQATLWSLPTDAALQAMDASAGPALTRLAVAVDAAQTADDPVASLCAWQRGQLDAWRAAPSLDNSPIVWAAAMTMTAPQRQHAAHS